MIKKLIIIALVITGAYIFYGKFLADTLKPFWKSCVRSIGGYGTRGLDIETNK